MDKTKIWIVASVLVMVGVLALGWFAGIDPQLQAKTATDEQRATVETQNQATELAIGRLKADFENIDELKTELATLRTSVPAAGSMPAFLTQLDNLARDSGTTVTKLTVSEAVEYTAPATAVAPAPAPEAEAEAEAPAEEPAPAPVEEEPETPSVITDPRVTSENFVVIPVSVEVSGSADGTRSFLDELQHGPRLFLATQIAIAPEGGDDSETFTATVSGYVYVLLNE
jgi:Tfp pilus assembly protein PilO